MFTDTNDLISDLLDDTVVQLDIPPELRVAATAEYERVGNWLAAHDDAGSGWVVHPQGSFLLNTVVRPEGVDEYDVDTVCRRDIKKTATTQAKLKLETGEALDAYRLAVAGDEDAPVALKERNRCWTLCYRPGMRFHLDTLPAIPNPEMPPTGILITDRELREWQRSDPLAYAAWFKGRTQREFLAKRARLAEAAHTPPQAIPEWQVVTTLHRTVQALKVHRNHHFRDDLKARPASILVTTLAALAYSGEQDLHTALVQAVERMPAHIARTPEGFFVPNPVEPRENFADRWNNEPELARYFEGWLAKLGEDLEEASDLRGVDKIASRLQESFGAEPVGIAAGRLADRYREKRDAGALTFVPATGILTPRPGGTRVRRHDFYGDVGGA